MNYNSFDFEKLVLFRNNRVSYVIDFINSIYQKFFKVDNPNCIFGGFNGFKSLPKLYGRCGLGSFQGKKMVVIELNEGFLKDEWSFEELVETIVHELIHVYQHITLGDSYCDSTVRFLKSPPRSDDNFLNYLITSHSQLNKEKLKEIRTLTEYQEFKNKWLKT